MGRTFIRQETQVRNSDLYDDTLSAGSTLESAPTDIEDDLNGLRSQIKRAIWDDGAGNWYDDIQTANGKKRAIRDLNVDLDDIEEKRLLYRSALMTDITVGAGNNFVVLNVAASEAPSVTAAVGGGTAEGAVVALLAGASGTHSLNEVSGPDAISPKSLVLIRDAVTGDPIMSSSREVYGLLQAESIVVDGDAFDDTTKQAQISLVRINVTGDDLEAATIADVENKVFNYAYVRRVKFDNVPETAFLTGTFIDQVPAATSVTLDAAIDNQTGAATQTDRDILWRITDTFDLKWQTSDGARDLLAIMPDSGGDEIEINIDTLDINNVNSVDFLNGAVFDSGGTAISVGAAAGVISSAAALTVASGGSSDLSLTAAGEFAFVDGNKGGSTYAGQLKLSDSSAEWDAYEAAFGEVSLLAAIAAGTNTFTKSVATVTAPIPADDNVTGAGGTPNLDAQLADYSAVDFIANVNVYVNGVLCYNGVDASANNDVYPGDVPADGDLKFEFPLKVGDVITLIICE